MRKTAIPETSSRRERQIRRKRSEILAAAARVFAAKGFSAATTKDIAAEADIGESTLYNYVESKREIMLAILDDSAELFDEYFQEASAVASREAFVEFVDRTIDLFTGRALFMRTLIGEAWIDDDILQNYVTARLSKISGVLATFFSKQMQAGLFRRVDPRMLARLAMGMFFSLVIPIARGVQLVPSPRERKALAETMVSVLIDGVNAQHAGRRTAKG